MKLDFRPTAVLSSFYGHGRLTSSPDGTLFFSPSESGLKVYSISRRELWNVNIELGTSFIGYTVAFDNSFVICLQNGGRCLVYDHVRNLLISRFNIKACTFLELSPTEHKLASASNRELQIWSLGNTNSLPFFSLKATVVPLRNKIVRFTWDNSGRFLLVVGEDNCLALLDTDSMKSIPIPRKLLSQIMGAFIFTKDDLVHAIIVHQNAQGFVYSFDLADCIKLSSSNQLELRVDRKDSSWISSVSFDPTSEISAVGFTSGVLGIFKLHPSGASDCLHAISMASSELSSLAISSSYPYVSLGCSKDCMFAIWDWSSECFVMKQSFHSRAQSLSFCSFDSRTIAIGDSTGKVLLFDSLSGYIKAALSPTQPISSPSLAVCFSGKKNRLLCAAHESGQVVVYDTIRSKAFRHVELGGSLSPLISLSPDSGLVVVASSDTWQINIVDIQQGKCIDTLSGHTGPISSLGFEPLGSYIWSSSWDKTVRIWTLLSATKPPRIFTHNSEVMCAALRPDGRELAAATLDGMIYFWSLVHEDEADPTAGTLLRSNNFMDSIRSKRKFAAKSFGTITSMKYSPDGSLLIITGKFPFVAIFDPLYCNLIKKLYLPKSAKNFTQLVDVSPEGNEIAVLVDGNVAIFTQKSSALSFDPSNLEVEVTPECAKNLFDEGSYLRALCMALRLNIHDVIKYVLLSTPSLAIPGLCGELPYATIRPILSHLSRISKESVHIVHVLQWLDNMLVLHGIRLRSEHDLMTQSHLRVLSKVFREYYRNLNDAAYFSIFAPSQ